MEVMNENVAELVGIILGDGHLHTKQYLITIVGGLEDLNYYEKRVIPLFQSLFCKIPTLRKRNDSNAYYLMIYSKDIFNFLLNDIGMRRGIKKESSVPDIIFSDKNLMRAFVRGLFDTDGCLKFSKQGRNINYYPRVQIALRKSPLANQLADLFKILDFPYGSWTESRFSGIVFYQISGKKNTERWFKEISPQNEVHTTKYEFWKKLGYYAKNSQKTID
ncbi:MAG: LAGLIDADG family homing endonuclease [Nanoarchaeota archaeon]|nr:LAGLIDADG family homing endonuclease [Nanoarchaeota archaeon]